jgi:hypothetical protein
MNERQALQKMREKGFIFDGAKGLITSKNIAKLASDSALITPPNSGVPAVFTTYIDPKVIDILTAPTNARKIFGETKKGDWTYSGSVFRAIEATGQSTAYTDFGNGATADINVTYPYRQNFLAQTNIRYGEQEMAVSGRAMINLAAEKQRSAATIINIDSNKYYLYGVSGKEIYGLLNEPNLPDTIAPSTVDSNITKWAQKTTQQIYDDILLLASELFKNSQGLVDQSSDLVLAVCPASNVLLGKATDYNVAVLDMLNKYFQNLTVVVLPELAATSGNVVMLAAREVQGNPVAELGFSEKMRALRVVPKTSWYEQKYVFGTYGAIIYRPFAIATMTGV